MSVLDRLLRELGITPRAFEIEEKSAFDLSPRAWLEKRLRAAGWVRRQGSLPLEEFEGEAQLARGDL